MGISEQNTALNTKKAAELLAEILAELKRVSAKLDQLAANQPVPH